MAAWMHRYSGHKTIRIMDDFDKKMRNIFITSAQKKRESDARIDAAERLVIAALERAANNIPSLACEEWAQALINHLSYLNRKEIARKYK
jgi:hypothetical protein